MVICADTSFLFSLYGNDINTPPALAWSEVNQEVICISCLNRFELINALRFAECRKAIATGNAGLFASQFLFP